jgi:alanyl-tRNA synthetase
MAWTVEQVERTFLDDMVARGHVVILGHSVLSPTDDVLFTTAGMHPLTPFLRGDLPHPDGRRLTDVQRCVRTTDVDEVGDDTHLTVFEMLGNWSLGDYFKEVSIPQSFDLLTGGFGIDAHRLYVTVFGGDTEVRADSESAAIWAQTFADAGVDPAGRITPLGADDNWWSNGPTGLCGPDTEIFVHVGSQPAPVFGDRPEFVEVWNNVFMTYDRLEGGELTTLAQRNVDTGMGLERITMFLNDHDSVWQTDELALLVDEVGGALGLRRPVAEEHQRSLRIVTDHLRGALVIAAAGVHPSPSRQGYVLRKLIRRAVRHAELITGTDRGLGDSIVNAAARIQNVMSRRWPDITGASGEQAIATVEAEAGRFASTLRKGVEHLQQQADQASEFDGALAFKLADTMGYPVELSAEEAQRIGMVMTPNWRDDYEARREEQRVRSRG